MVTEYTPSVEKGCSYKLYGFKDVVYLFPKDFGRNIKVDTSDTCYIDSLEAVPARLEAFNISLTEETSLDERYRFNKTVTFSMKGLVNINITDYSEHVMLESKDGTLWMVNVDFPAKMTYMFQLSENINQTDFTFTSISNFPTLQVNGSFKSKLYDECRNYQAFGIESLQLNDKQFCTLDTVEKEVIVYRGYRFQDVEFNPESCTLTEEYDGEKITDTITFNIDLDAYKSSWHYNLLEFENNRYSAIIKAKNNDNTYYLGFNYGLSPLYTIQAGSNSESDIVTVTLKEVSLYGLTAAEDYWNEELLSGKRWRYVRYVGDLRTYECIGYAEARYLVMEEYGPDGKPTGDYKCLDSYEAYFKEEGLNIIDVFYDDVVFYEPECLQSEVCKFDTNIPKVIRWGDVSCKEFYIDSNCEWYFDMELPHIRVTPNTSSINGTGRTTVSICNTMIPTDTMVEGELRIRYGRQNYTFNTQVQKPNNGILPEEMWIDCRKQTVSFKIVNQSCQFRIIGHSNVINVNIQGGEILATVPKNISTEEMKDYWIEVSTCSGKSVRLLIHQDKMYERWQRSITGEYICIDGSSYEKLVRYTAYTDSQFALWAPTDEVKAGNLLIENDTRCLDGQTQFRFNGHYVCLDGNKFELMEEFITYDYGQSWTPTGVVQPGIMVEKNSDWCNDITNPITFKWVLSTEWQCDI